MKKWFDYQIRTQALGTDYENRFGLVMNVNDELSSTFTDITSMHQSGVLETREMNIYLTEDWIDKTVASTGGEVSKEQYMAWVNEYRELVDGHGHEYIYSSNEFTDNRFTTLEEKLNDVFAKRLNLKRETLKSRIHVEKPGHYFMLHHDRNVFKNWSNKDIAYKEDETLHNTKVYVVFLDDQKMGQMMQFGLQNIHWKKGDVFYFEHQTVPHCTCNVGFDTNYIMVINGIPNDR
jgi:dGTP triphosphohydrolase